MSGLDPKNPASGLTRTANTEEPPSSMGRIQ